MIPATTPERLLEVAGELKERGCKGILISGGADGRGVVPLVRFAGAIGRLKKEFGLLTAVHTGIVTKELASSLAQANIDCAMLDIIGADETVREVYSLDVGASAYYQSLANVTKYEIPASPHIVIGLHWGRVVGEKRAIDFAAEFPLASLVLVVVMPLPGTEMESIRPASSEEIGEVIRYARERMPDTALLLGCARPAGKEREIIDRLAIEIGVDGIAYPEDGTVAFAREKGLTPRFSELCCSLIFLGEDAPHM
jgi:hypothetical protein